jgi:hypothetical protein
LLPGSLPPDIFIAREPVDRMPAAEVDVFIPGIRVHAQAEVVGACSFGEKPIFRQEFETNEKLI